MLSGQLATHVVWELVIGKVPRGNHLHHTCHNLRCVRPGHLASKTPLEHDQAHGRRKCPDGESTGIIKRRSGKVERYCKVCRNAYERERLRMKG
jgi:hypothetical protein